MNFLILLAVTKDEQDRIFKDSQQNTNHNKLIGFGTHIPRKSLDGPSNENNMIQHGLSFKIFFVWVTTILLQLFTYRNLSWSFSVFCFGINRNFLSSEEYFFEFKNRKTSCFTGFTGYFNVWFCFFFILSLIPFFTEFTTDPVDRTHYYNQS